LDRNHTCFGKVVSGIEHLEAIRQGDAFSVEIID
jgi:cyclophilin family peptidyl-prolyl cis-trans isomerase